MNEKNPVNPVPIRCGEQVHTLPVSGDNLIGRVNAVYSGTRREAGGAGSETSCPTPNAQRLIYYRVRFPIVSPYFRDDAGVIYRAHEVERFIEPPPARVKTKLPPRPKPTKPS